MSDTTTIALIIDDMDTSRASPAAAEPVGAAECCVFCNYCLTMVDVDRFSNSQRKRGREIRRCIDCIECETLQEHKECTLRLLNNYHFDLSQSQLHQMYVTLIFLYMERWRHRFDRNYNVAK